MILKEELFITNVMMSIGDDFILVCLESILDEDERKKVKESIESTGRNIIEIDLKQMECFNVYFQLDEKGNKIVVISNLAFSSLTTNQKQILSSESKILNIPIPVIQKM